jgi:hypothetical protein
MHGKAIFSEFHGTQCMAFYKALQSFFKVFIVSLSFFKIIYFRKFNVKIKTEKFCKKTKKKRLYIRISLKSCPNPKHYRFENCGALRAFFNPYFRRSLIRASRVKYPRCLNELRRFGNTSKKALHNAKRLA